MSMFSEQQGEWVYHSNTDTCDKVFYSRPGDVIYVTIDGRKTPMIVREEDAYFIQTSPPLSFFPTPEAYMNYMRGDKYACSLSYIAHQSIDELKRAYRTLGFPLGEYKKVFEPEISDPRENSDFTIER